MQNSNDITTPCKSTNLQYSFLDKRQVDSKINLTAEIDKQIKDVCKLIGEKTSHIKNKACKINPVIHIFFIELPPPCF